jgi:hypothetical protein
VTPLMLFLTYITGPAIVCGVGVILSGVGAVQQFVVDYKNRNGE